MSSGVRELRVWQEAVSLAGDVIRTVRQHVRRETTSVSDSLMATAIAAGTHIADGYGRHTVVEQRVAYLEAKRALLRLETELAIARHAELIPAGSFTELTARSSQVARLLAGYIVYLDRQIADGDATLLPRASHGVRRSSPPAAPVPLREAFHEIDGSQAGERRGLHADDALRRAGEVR